MKKLIKLATVAMLCGLFAVFVTGCSSSSNSSVSSSESSFSSIAEPEQRAVDLSSRYILVIGDDSWENYKPGRADLMMLMCLDFQKHQISLVTVPRDTKYTTFDGTVEKLNQVYCDSGAAAQCKAVSEITGVEVSDYVCVGFDGLQSIVESFGGLNIDLPYSLDYSFYTKDYPNEQFEAGLQTLTPWRAAALARTRTSYGDYNLDQDMMRQLVNRRMMASFDRRRLRRSFEDGFCSRGFAGRYRYEYLYGRSGCLGECSRRWCRRNHDLRNKWSVRRRRRRREQSLPRYL